MKKKGFVLSLLLVFCMLVMPTIASATEVFLSEDSTGTKTTEGGVTVTCPKNASGTIATCYIGVNVTGGSLKEFKITANLKNLTYRAVNGRNGWTATKSDDAAGSVTYTISNSTGLNAGEKAIVAQINFDVTDPAAECSVTLDKFTPTTPDTPSVTPKCDIENGKDGQTVYYCEDGTQCTKEEYDKRCTTEDNPQTGSFLPYAVIIGGLAVAAGLYMVTKKNKIYHM